MSAVARTRNLYTIEKIKSVLRKKKYAFFTAGAYNLNSIFIRSTNSKSNSYDDVHVVIYRNHVGQWKVMRANVTTDAGKHWLLNPMNIRGTAILAPCQVSGAHSLGTHRGYTALRQRKPIPFVRDNNRDTNLDFSLYKNAMGKTWVYPPNNPNVEYNKVILANIHRAGRNVVSRLVNKWSAACMVYPDNAQFQRLLELVRLQKQHHGTTSLTFTLLEEEDFN